MHKHQPLISIYCWRRPIPAHPAAEHELFKETLAISSLTWFDPTKQEYDPKCLTKCLAFKAGFIQISHMR
jgi:hypothetical protein